MVSLSVVIIGLNEQSHLHRCIESVLASTLRPTEAIYVDGGSADESVEIARRFPINVVAMHPAHPTPGLGRNEGLRRCHGDFVQFVDGDMTLATDWLRHAVSHLAGDQSIACVYGRTSELNRSRSVYNWVLSVDWEAIPAGEASAPGGGGLFRTSLLRDLGGYADDLVAAEETELGTRIRRAGYRIVNLGADMAYHDLDMHSFAQYWRRGLRGGVARAQLIEKNPQMRFAWSLVKPDVYVLAALSSLFSALLLRRFEVVASLLSLAALMAFRQAWVYYRQIGNPYRCLLFGLHRYFSMIPSSVGRALYSLRLLP